MKQIEAVLSISQRVTPASTVVETDAVPDNHQQVHLQTTKAIVLHGIMQSQHSLHEWRIQKGSLAAQEVYQKSLHSRHGLSQWK